uniref:UDP-3-O-acyl-N-acetylglucosamine deacetylase n=2 Tax=Anthurium amnicola TaxID=1678845 RepID=A0A1D1XG26_9ARAE
MAGEGRYFSPGPGRPRIPATVDHVVESPLCTTLRRGAARVLTVEHLLSALEASGVDNARLEIDGGDEVPILDGSAREWVEAIEEAGLCAAKDHNGNEIAKLATLIHEPMYVWRDDSFVAAFPQRKTKITYGISFPQVPAIGCRWFSCFPMDDLVYAEEIGPSRTFCIYEEIESLRNAGLIRGGSIENAIVCSGTTGWQNPPLRFHDEPCRHKILDLIGDISLLSENGNQGLPIGHLIAYKAGHALHAKFARHLKDLMMKLEPEMQPSVLKQLSA